MVCLGCRQIRGIAAATIEPILGATKRSRELRPKLHDIHSGAANDNLAVHAGLRLQLGLLLGRLQLVKADYLLDFDLGILPQELGQHIAELLEQRYFLALLFYLVRSDDDGERFVVGVTVRGAVGVVQRELAARTAP